MNTIENIEKELRALTTHSHETYKQILRLKEKLTKKRVENLLNTRMLHEYTLIAKNKKTIKIIHEIDEALYILIKTVAPDENGWFSIPVDKAVCIEGNADDGDIYLTGDNVFNFVTLHNLTVKNSRVIDKILELENKIKTLQNEIIKLEEGL